MLYSSSRSLSVLTILETNLLLPVCLSASLKHAFNHDIEPETVEEEKYYQKAAKHTDEIQVESGASPVI
jgi:hypothetical protein